MAARQPTIIATSIGFQPEGPDPMNVRPGPSYLLAADLAGAGDHPRLCILATAVGDDSPRLAAAHNAFSKIGFVSSQLTQQHKLRNELLYLVSPNNGMEATG